MFHLFLHHKEMMVGEVDQEIMEDREAELDRLVELVQQ